jgi:hypothetical protein
MSEPAAPATTTNSAANANTAGLVTQNSNAALREPQGAGAPARGHGGADAQPAEADAVREADQPSAASPAPPPPAASAEAPAVLSKSGPKPVATEEGEVARGDNKEKSENRDKSARASEPAEDVASNDAAAQRSRASQSRMNEVQMPDGGARNQQKRGADNNASTGYGNAAGGAGAAPKDSERERASSRSESSGRTRAARQVEQKTDDEGGAQTRNAAGHRFRREGSAWVDVNYKSSLPSTGVRRGTEAFRALVADVPEVGRVAEAFGGEVIVVVGGHAYHIR